MDDMEYAGFWVRVGAALIETVLMMFIIVVVRRLHKEPVCFEAPQ